MDNLTGTHSLKCVLLIIRRQLLTKHELETKLQWSLLGDQSKVRSKVEKTLLAAGLYDFQITDCTVAEVVRGVTVEVTWAKGETPATVKVAIV